MSWKSDSPGLGVITLSRAPVNAYDRGFLRQLRLSIEAVDATPGVEVVVIASALSRAFAPAQM